MQPMAVGYRSMTSIGDLILRTAARLPWSGEVHRSHRPTLAGDDARFSLLGGGRWNVGQGDPSGRQPFPALYTATSPLVATWERLRHLDDSSVGAMKAGLRTVLSRLDISLPSALDLRSPTQFGIDAGVLLGSDYEIEQEISAAAYDEGLAGLLVPTATGLGAADGDYNVVIFFVTSVTSQLVYGTVVPDAAPRTGTTVRVIGVEAPSLPP